MKIEKLYTLSQFIDYIRQLGERYTLRDERNYIFKYNDFLKQPLTKEMFVNELKKQKCYDNWLNGDFPSIELMKECKAWQESEKKVIFEDFINIHRNSYTNDVFDISFRHDGILVLYNIKTGITTFCKNLSDISEATNGKLKLKNVDL